MIEKIKKRIPQRFMKRCNNPICLSMMYTGQDRFKIKQYCDEMCRQEAIRWNSIDRRINK